MTDEEIIGQVLAVTFLDHAHGASDPLAFVVYGRCVEATPDKLVVDSWAYADPTINPDDEDANVERFVIVRSAVQQLLVMV